MENFMFSLNVTIPIFLVMVLGWGLKQTGMLNDNFVTVANKFSGDSAGIAAAGYFFCGYSGGI